MIEELWAFEMYVRTFVGLATSFGTTHPFCGILVLPFLPFFFLPLSSYVGGHCCSLSLSKQLFFPVLSFLGCQRFRCDVLVPKKFFHNTRWCLEVCIIYTLSFLQTRSRHLKEPTTHHLIERFTTWEPHNRHFIRFMDGFRESEIVKCSAGQYFSVKYLCRVSWMGRVWLEWES